MLSAGLSIQRRRLKQNVNRNRPLHWKSDGGSSTTFRPSSRLQAAVRRALLSIDNHTYRTVVVPMVAFLPAPLAYGVALVRSDLRYRLMRSSRQKIIYSLGLLFGDRLSQRERDRVARDNFRSMSCETIDAMRLLGSGKALLGLVEVRGLEHLRAALAGGKGAVLCSAHFGSPKSCFSIIGALGFPITIVARWRYHEKRRKRLLSKLVYRLRNDYPVNSHLHRPNIERHPGTYGTAVQAAMVLRRNELVGIMIDAEVRPGDPSKPMTFDFLNGKATLVPGATEIAQLTGAPVMVMLLRRLADWRHQVLEISPPIHVEGDPVVAFKQCLALIEAAIQRYPAQWRPLPVSRGGIGGALEVYGFERSNL